MFGWLFVLTFGWLFGLMFGCLFVLTFGGKFGLTFGLTGCGLPNQLPNQLPGCLGKPGCAGKPGCLGKPGFLVKPGFLGRDGLVVGSLPLGLNDGLIPLLGCADAPFRLIAGRAVSGLGGNGCLVGVRIGFFVGKGLITGFLG